MQEMRCDTCCLQTELPVLSVMIWEPFSSLSEQVTEVLMHTSIRVASCSVCYLVRQQPESVQVQAVTSASFNASRGRGGVGGGTAQHN